MSGRDQFSALDEAAWDQWENSQARQVGAIRTRRAPLGTGIKILYTVVAAASFSCLFVIPALALRADLSLSEKSGVIQATTSWWAAILAISASVIALLAYRNSIQRPNLDIRMKNSLDTLTLTLKGRGNASAARPFVRLRFPQPQTLVPVSHEGWREEDFIGGGGHETLTWYDDDVTVHPGMHFHLPFVSFNTGPLIGRSSRDYVEVTVLVSWACDGQLVREKSYVLSFPSAR